MNLILICLNEKGWYYLDSNENSLIIIIYSYFDYEQYGGKILMSFICYYSVVV